MESYDKRSQRFQNGHPDEIIQTLLNSLDNNVIAPLEQIKTNYTLAHTLILSIYSVIETISEHVLLKPGKEGIKYYLEYFVDGDVDDLKYSYIIDDINSWRNILAHQFISKKGHEIGYNYQMNQGYKNTDGVLWINPKIMYEQFFSAYRHPNNKTQKNIYDYSSEEMRDIDKEKVKQHFLEIFQKY